MKGRNPYCASSIGHGSYSIPRLAPYEDIRENDTSLLNIHILQSLISLLSIYLNVTYHDIINLSHVITMLSISLQVFEIPLGTGRIIYLGYDYSEPITPWVHALVAATMFNDYDFEVYICICMYVCMYIYVYIYIYIYIYVYVYTYIHIYMMPANFEIQKRE